MDESKTGACLAPHERLPRRCASSHPPSSPRSRECIVEGEGRSGRRSSGREAIGASFGWLKDTRWNWNRWRDVIFRADGSFLAPAEGCEAEGNPACRWYTSQDDVIVK